MKTEKTKTVPTDSQIQVLMSDWLGNLRMKDEGNYTHKGGEGIIHKGESPSRYLMGEIRPDDDPAEVMKRARGVAENLALTIAGKPLKVYVGNGQSYQNEENGRKAITLATDFFDRKDIDMRQKADIFIGLACHEAAHAAFTDKEVFEEEVFKGPKEIISLRKDIWNLLEDERIEFLVGEERPGCADFLGATKEQYFKRVIKELRINGQFPTEPIPKLIAALTLAVRYPSQMVREDVEDSFEELDQIRKILSPYPLTQQSCWRATDRILDVMKDIIKKQLQQQQQEQEQQQQEQEQQPQDDSRQDGDEQSSPDQQQAGGQSETPSSEDNDQNDSAEDEESKQKPKKKKSPGKSEVLKELAKALQTNEAQAVLNAVHEDESKGNGGNASVEVDNYGEYINDDDAERTGAGGGYPDTFILKPAGDADNYLDAFNNVRALVGPMSKSLACRSHEQDWTLRGMPSGKLNTNKFAAFRCGNKNIFTKSGTTKTTGACVCVLIDESGSMSGQREQKAREAAILINEAIKRIHNVTYFCYGFTTELIHVFAEPGHKNRWALSATDSISGTPTGEAMNICAERIRRMTQDPCIMLVLTDGYPDSASKVVSAVQELKRNRFHPIGVGILCEAVSNLFDEYVVINDLQSFPSELGSITRKKLDKMIVRSDEE